MLKVAYLMNTLNVGGLEKYVVEICNRLDRRRFAPLIISFSDEGNVLDHLQREDVPVCILDKRDGNDWRLPGRIAAVCDEHQVDVLHSNNWGTLVETAFATKKARGVRWLHVQHGLEYLIRRDLPRHRRWLQNVAAYWALRQAHAVAAVSQATQRFVAGAWGYSAARLIYNGVELNPYRDDLALRCAKRKTVGIPEDAPVVLSVGRLAPVKNYPCLVEAHAEVRRRWDGRKSPPPVLVLVGDGPDRERIQKTVSRCGLEDSVFCLGRRADVPELLIAGDLFVLPSLSEGVSLSILEAMSAGLPVVATDVGGNPELVDGAVGQLVSPQDSGALAEAIHHLLADAERREQCGESARARVEREFSFSQMVETYESLYIELAEA